MKSYIFIGFSLNSAFASQTALAHSGHIADHGAGHSHWLALIIFSSLTLTIVGHALSSLYTGDNIELHKNQPLSR